MGAYRLDPIVTDHPCWEASSHNGFLWVGAQTPHQARELAAAFTLVISKPSHPYAPRPVSPWLLADVTSCVWYPDRNDIPEGAVEGADRGGAMESSFAC